jgi:hypothetical protein
MCTFIFKFFNNRKFITYVLKCILNEFLSYFSSLKASLLT